MAAFFLFALGIGRDEGKDEAVYNRIEGNIHLILRASSLPIHN